MRIKNGRKRLLRKGKHNLIRALKLQACVSIAFMAKGLQRLRGQIKHAPLCPFLMRNLYESSCAIKKIFHAWPAMADLRRAPYLSCRNPVKGKNRCFRQRLIIIKAGARIKKTEGHHAAFLQQGKNVWHVVGRCN